VKSQGSRKIAPITVDANQFAKLKTMTSRRMKAPKGENAMAGSMSAELANLLRERKLFRSRVGNEMIRKEITSHVLKHRKDYSEQL